MKQILRGAISLLIFISVISVSKSYSQDVEFKRSGNWEFMYEVDGVNFYYKVTECNDTANGYFRELVLLKLENTNDFVVNVQWDVQMYYNGICFHCDEKPDPERHRTVELNSSSTVEGRCFTHGDKTLTIFSRFLNYSDPTSTLTKFELINLVISSK
ncbi:hypothetical protein SDC9_59086 [bioreactor metagenome]|uniref:Uncharacterized protein n=1 Tax=bioreactor metagenome TaxID=1076179 RepID=A0A644X989_9ZZZZ